MIFNDLDFASNPSPTLEKSRDIWDEDAMSEVFNYFVLVIHA